MSNQLPIGPTESKDTQMGPVISAAQCARCEHFVALAVENGGRVAVGGKRPAHLDKSYYFEPTVLDVPDNKNPAAQEEIFDPVITVIGYRDLDHAVNINGGAMRTYVSSGGQKQSGIGRERGIEGLRLYQQLTCLNICG